MIMDSYERKNMELNYDKFCEDCGKLGTINGALCPACLFKIGKLRKNRLNAFYLPEETKVSEQLLMVWKDRHEWPLSSEGLMRALIEELQSYQEAYLRGSQA